MKCGSILVERVCKSSTLDKRWMHEKQPCQKDVSQEGPCPKRVCAVGASKAGYEAPGLDQRLGGSVRRKRFASLGLVVEASWVSFWGR